MTTATVNLAGQFSAAVQQAYLDGSGPQRFDALRARLAKLLGLQADDVFVAVITGAPMVASVVEDQLGAKCRLMLAVLAQGEELQAAASALARVIGGSPMVDAAAICALSSYGDWYIPSIICRAGDGVGAKIRDLLSPSAEVILPFVGPAAATRGPAGTMAGSPLVLDDRVMRMARLALASSSAVVLVGPPGTGKTTLVKKLLQEASANPAAFGLARAPREPKWATPAEDWNSCDLIGGENIDERGRRRFHLGHVLEAIRQDKWLVLDEANRANMDKIFGPLLTWLSDQRVELGRASVDLTSPAVVLDWNDRPECRTQRLELLEAERIVSSEPIRFMAGMDWRLIGTYNVQDAHRVFSFGHALGRRFARVPIPAIEPGQFRQVLAPLVKGLPEMVGKIIVGMYAAHRRSTACQLGPAIFLKIASYVNAGLKLPQLAHASVVVQQGATASDLLMQLIAEAYLSSAGSWLAHLSADDLDGLGKAVVESGFPKSDWDWIRSLTPMLG